MALTEQTINIRVKDAGIEPRLYMVQADTGRSFRCVLEDWDIPSGASAKVYVRKISGKVVYNVCTVDESTNSVVIDVTSQMIAEAGADNLAMVEITYGDECVTTFAFFLVVKYKFGEGPESENESTWVDQLMQKYIDEAEELLKDTQDAAADAADSAKTAKDAASDAAKSAGEAESAASAASDAASQAESSAASAAESAASAAENAESVLKAADEVLAESQKIDERLDRAEGLIDSTLEAAEKAAQSAADAEAAASTAQEAADRAEKAAESVTDLEVQIKDLEERVEYLESLHGIGVEKTPFAVYCEDDNSLTFYEDVSVPDVGSTYNGKAATTVYDVPLDSVASTYTLIPWHSDRTLFTSVVFDGTFADARPIGLRYWFYNMSNMTLFDGKWLDTSAVTSLYNTFYGCSSLTSVDGLAGWDTSAVTSLYGMFQNCSGLTSVDSLAGWNTGAVTSMQYTFRDCSGLTSVDGLAGWDTSAVISLYGMFQNCSGLTSVDGLAGWDTSAVTALQYTFYGCSGLTSVDISKWNTANVTNMNQTFYGCSKLKTVYSDDAVFVTTKVTNGTNMFYKCNALVGGNGTAYSSSDVTYTMAHVDTPDNPGYFTAK